MKGRSSSSVITVTAATAVVICFLISSVSCGKRSSRHHHPHESSKLVAGPEPDHTYISKSAEPNVCQGWYCGHGRECREGSDGAPECICIRECKDRRKEICGNDGRRYASHCELHRTACLLNSHLAVDHSNACFRKSHASKSGSRSKSRTHHDYESDADAGFDYYNSEKRVDDEEDDDDDADDGDTDDGNIDIGEENDRVRKGFKSDTKNGNKRRKSSSERNNRDSASSTKIPQRQKQRKHEASSDEDTFDDEFIDRESEDLPARLDERYNPAPKRKKLDAQLLDSEVDLDSVLNSDGQVRSSAPAAAGAGPASSSTSSDNGAAANNFFSSSGRSGGSATITGEIRRDSSVCSPQEYEILKVHYESDADAGFDYYNSEKRVDDEEDDDDDADDGDTDDGNIDIGEENDRVRKGFKSDTKNGNKRRKSSSERNNRDSASSTKIPQRQKQRKHEASSDEDTFDDEFIDRESEDLPARLDERYNPAPKRKKLDAQLLDSEVDLDSVLNSDGQVRSSAPAAAGAGPASSSTSSDNGAAANNFFSSSGRSGGSATITGEIRRDSSVCSPQEYEILKDNLLLYNHERTIGGVRNFKAAMESENSAKGSHVPDKLYFDEALGDGPEGGKDYLLSLMFSHFDRNNNGGLEYDELHRIDKDEMMGKLASGCNMVDLLRFDDSDHNGQLNINEFYTAFNKLYSVSVISLDKALEITHVSATVGDNVEIKCDVSGSPPMPIVWRRYGVDLSTLNQEDQVRVFSDGTLYLNKIQLLHAGNYSCHAQRNQEVIQTHILSVQTLPDVKVMPHIVWERPGQDVTMECRVMGEPFPVVQWLKNDDPLPLEMSNKYLVTGDGIRLTLKDIYFSDTGAYMCKAENSAGNRLDISSLVVIDQQTPSTVQANESQFFVFHERGISVYDPTNCRLQHQIQATDIIPGTHQEYVCGDHGVICEWGRAIRVSSTYVYLSQPKMDRVLVISTTQMVVVDVVPTDRYPVELHYVPHLDQVWVECWRSQDDDSQKTLQVIRDAKEKRKHHTVHPEPIDSHFDLVEALFLPPDLKSSSQFRYGYVSHKNGRGLYKMDLIALRYTKSVDLTPYNCVPKNIEFSALYGMVIVECFEPVINGQTRTVNCQIGGLPGTHSILWL